MQSNGKYAINTVHQTNNCGQLEVIGYISTYKRKVRFASTGYVTEVDIRAIQQGCIKDPYVTSLYGVACLGEPEEHPLRKTLYKRWEKMLYRVIVAKSGKIISPEWMCFANFMRDALRLPGIEQLSTHTKTKPIDLDSDIIPLAKGIPPTYSKETCQWVTRAENCKACERPKTHNVRPIGTVIETRHGPVTIMAKNGDKWLIRFHDGVECWRQRCDILRDTFGKPDTSEV
jgi:hypothetical protein